MTCEWITSANGVQAIVCSRSKRGRKCVVCGKHGADRLCDGKQDLVRTCDRPLHRSCAHQEGDKDFCVWHTPVVTIQPPEGWGP